MLERISWGRHAVVGSVAAGASLLGLFGAVGEGELPERFDAKHVTVTPHGVDGLRIREVIDQDFGTHRRHGLERTIPTDFGVPTDIVASSPDAPDDLHLSARPSELRIRLGDPDVTITGQHRYVVEFTLPDARLSSGDLALDVIGTTEAFETGRFEVVVAGLDLDDPRCNVGRAGDRGGCALERDRDVYRAVISPLRPQHGITIGGAVTGRHPPAAVPIPDPPARRGDPDRASVAVLMLAAGLLAGGAVHAFAAWRGRNEVFGGGAVDAAFGTLAPPGPAPAGRRSRRATTHVTDRRLGELATIEFAPPDGIEPWQGAVLVGERIGDHTVSAWFSGAAAREYIDLEAAGSTLVIRPGRRMADADEATTRILTELFRGREVVSLAGYDSKFASVWRDVRRLQDDAIRRSGWWKHLAPRAGLGALFSPWFVAAILAAVTVGTAAVVLALFGLFSSTPLALAFAIFMTASTAFFVYLTLLPARTAAGSALTLRTESFRRFLAASEGRHVESAWQRGVIREYSAWAVALGAARAWRRALQASSIGDATLADVTAPLLMHTMSTAVTSSHTAPSESSDTSGSSGSSGSSGGFSGASVGGGGGGGSSGSW